MTIQQYDRVMQECIDLFAKKADDYGAAWRVLRVASITDQVYIKAKRVRTIQEAGKSRVKEGIRPELVAMVNYGAMALVQLEQGVVDEPDMPPREAIGAVRAKMDEAKALMERKNHDYGEAWRNMRVGSIVDLILVKLYRIKQIEDNEGQTLVSEGIASNYLDIINYAAFALILLDEQER